jgi:subtilisin-like proprotein convertase family protein
MKPRVVLAAAALIASAGVAFANGEGGATDLVMFDAPDPVALSLEDFDRADRNLAPRFAIAEPTNLTPEIAGTWRKIDEHLSSWSLRISSPGVENINLGFTSFELPEGASLIVSATDGSASIRPFTADDNNAAKQLWTPVVPSDDVTIELIVPHDLRDKVELGLTSVNLGYRPFGERNPISNRSGACNVDVVCTESEGWEDEIDSVAVISTGGSTFCTGFMVNNVRQDRRPLFMTAYHCGIRSGDAPSLVAYWNFENSTCRTPGSGASGGAGDGVLSDFNTGSTLLAENSASDMTLVVLNNPPAEEFEVAYAGWDATFYEPIGVVAIHHPSTDEKRISWEYDQTTSVVGLTSSPEVPVETSTHLKVPDWDLGTTEPGSSGSPVFDLNTQRVLGQLHGGTASCSSQTYDAYGRIARSWDNGSPSNSLRNHLDPDNTGALFVDTLPANGAVVSPTGGVFAYGVVGGPFTQESESFTLENLSPTAIDYEIAIAPGGDLPLLLNGGTASLAGNLGQGGSLNFQVELASGAFALSAGLYASEVVITDLTNNTAVSRVFELEVGLSGIEVTPAGDLLAGGPVGGPFTATQMYTISSTRPTPATLSISASAPWISLNGADKPLDIVLSSEGQSQNIIVSFNSVANTLPAGLAQGTVDFVNLTDGNGSATRDVTLDVGRFRYAPDDLPQNITSNNTIASTIFVPDSVCVADVDVAIDITHTFIGDLRITLESPDGTVVTLHDRTGGSSDDIVTEYNTGVNDPDGPGSLADFNGVIASGLWVLTVADLAGGDEGTLNDWELKIAATGSDCPPIADDVSVSIGAGEPVSVQLSATSQNGSGAISYAIASLPSQGTLFLPGTVTEITSAPFALPGDSVTYLADQAAAGSDSFTYIANDGQDSLPATVGVSVVSGNTIYNFPMDTDPNWTATGQWEFGVPQGIDEDPSSGFTGSNVYGYNLAGEYTNNMSPETLTTQALDMTGVTGATLKFQRWIGVESSTWDDAKLEVSNDGSNWTELWSNPNSTIREDAWTEVSYDISAVADNQPAVFVRWTMGATDSSVTYAGWNIDDVAIEGTLPPCPGDIDGDQVVGTTDLLVLLGSWGTSVLPNTSGDLTGDGQVGTADLLELLSAWGQPC